MQNNRVNTTCYSANTYTLGLLNEYDEILLDKKKKYSGMFFDFSDSVNERMALSVFKYAIETYLKWTPLQAADFLTKDVLKQMKLYSLLVYIKFPAELNPRKDYWYIIHKIYPKAIPIDTRNLITNMYSKIISGEIYKFPRDYFFDDIGSVKACVCLQYMLERYIVFNSIEDMYVSFADDKINTVLTKYKLDIVCQLFFSSPLEFLHAALPDAQKDEFLYQYLRFNKDFSGVINL